MKHEIVADSMGTGKKDSAEVNFRQGSVSFQGWDTFRHTFKSAGACDPLIVVSKIGNGYRIQWGTYYEEKGPAVTATTLGPIGALVGFFVTTAIRQVTEGPGLSRYFYSETDLNSGKTLPVQHSPAGLLRQKIDEYETSRQKKNKSPFERKSYIPFLDGAVAIYRLSPRAMIGVTQLVYFD